MPRLTQGHVLFRWQRLLRFGDAFAQSLPTFRLGDVIATRCSQHPVGLESRSIAVLGLRNADGIAYQNDLAQDRTEPACVMGIISEARSEPAPRLGATSKQLPGNFLMNGAFTPGRKPHARIEPAAGDWRRLGSPGCSLESIGAKQVSCRGSFAGAKVRTQSLHNTIRRPQTAEGCAR
jgi:hypothetical protein